MKPQLSEKNYKRILRFQRDEKMGTLLYAFIASRQKDERNKKLLLELSAAEQNHYDIWQGYTGKDIAPNKLLLLVYKLCFILLGFSFTIKFMERLEGFGIKELESIEGEIAEARDIMKDEEEHENSLLELMDEERLHYVGSMVLGLNDALVELTGTIAGLTFALANTRLVALSGIITGISATLSMAASNYLAERANGNKNALKSSLYTGVAYLITVVLMVLPYLLLPNNLYAVAFAIMIAVVILIILVFNYYLSVAQSQPFLKKFGEMAVISLSVALISFVIGYLAKTILGIDV